MYCVKCGVALADTENKCPLCGTSVYHPDIVREKAEPTYPAYVKGREKMRPQGVLFILTILCLMPIAITLFCDLYFGNGLTWAGYPVGGIILFYSIFILPSWFYRPNPVIFCPISFGVLGAFLLYVNFQTEGDWFLTFAFPILVFVALLVCTVVTLLRYTRRGRLYIAGGTFIAVYLDRGNALSISPSARSAKTYNARNNFPFKSTCLMIASLSLSLSEK